MRTISTAICVLSLVAACGSKKDDKPDKPAGPDKLDVKAIWADFSGGLQGTALRDKYRDPVTFTAPVKSVGEEVDHSPIVMLDVDGKNMITLKFADPKVVVAKAPKAGDALTVTCKIGGANGVLMMALACTM